MASVAYLLDDAYNIFLDIKEREDEAESNRSVEFVAARCIQRWVRGFLVRRHIQWLHSQAVIIQKRWRGYLGRKRYLIILKERVDEMCWNYYNLTATRIQKTWRGYYIRTRVFNYKEFKEWRAEVIIKNEKLKQDMKNFYNQSIEYNKAAREREALHTYIHILYKNHHLLRTTAIPGVYSNRDTTELSVMEQRIKCLKYADYIRACHKENMKLKKAEKKHSAPHLIFKVINLSGISIACKKAKPCFIFSASNEVTQSMVLDFKQILCN